MMLSFHVVDCPLKRGRSKLSPSAAAIKAAREGAGLTQEQAAQMLHSTLRTWQQWEAGDRGMHLAFWELFSLKTKPVH